MEPGESCHRRPRFRICSRSWFLTYPKCSLGKEEALALLKAKRPAKGIVVARELHEDGTPHLHAYVMLNAEFNCTASSYWDLQGWHGNYQHAKSWCKVLAYIKKDQDYLQEETLMSNTRPGRGRHIPPTLEGGFRQSHSLSWLETTPSCYSTTLG